MYDTLIHLEAQLMEASELFLTDKMSEAVYKSMVQGVMMSLPRLRAPQHIVVVLKAVRKWYLASMLPECFKQPTMDMLLEAAYSEGDFDDGAGSSSAPATPAPPPPRVKEASSKRKQKATLPLQPGQQSLFNWKGAERQRPRMRSCGSSERKLFATRASRSRRTW